MLKTEFPLIRAVQRVTRLCKKISPLLYKWTKHIEHGLIFSMLKKFDLDIDEYESSVTGEKREIIWTCWWQGEENAPQMVRRCIDSIKKNAGGRQVVVIDERNVSSYISLPQHIVDKHEQKQMTTPHYSDLVRLALLSEYGGLWLDATIFVFKPISDAIFEMPLYTCKYEHPDSNRYMPNQYGNTDKSLQMLASNILGGERGHPFWIFSFNLLTKYWEKHASIVAYFLMDYALKLAYDTVAAVKKDIDAIPVNGNDRFELEKMLNLPYAQDEIDALANSDTLFFKLNLYREYKDFTESGEETVYRRFCHGAFTYTVEADSE